MPMMEGFKAAGSTMALGISAPCSGSEVVTVLVGLWLSPTTIPTIGITATTRFQLLRQLSRLWLWLAAQRQADLVLLPQPCRLLSICDTLQHRVAVRSRLCKKP
jgi:hypothetical protein